MTAAAPQAERPAAARQGVTPAAFAQAIADGRVDEAADQLIQFLELVRKGAGPTLPDDAQRTAAFAWWAAQAMRLLGDDRLTLTDARFRRLAARLRELGDLLGCTDEGNADALLARVAGQVAARGIDAGTVARLLLALSLDSEREVGLADLFTVAPDHAWRAWAGLAAAHTVLTPRAHAARQALFALAPRLVDCDVPFEELNTLAQAWYLCSYDDAPDKHDVKAHLNAAFRRSMADADVVARPLAPRPARRHPRSDKNLTRRAKPRLLVPLEAFRSEHAMHRCYAPRVAALRERFEVIGAAEPTVVDDASAALFDHMVPLARTRAGFREAVRTIGRLAPDIAWYPSVGMATEVIALANLRLAPVQVASLGHPATTRSPVMDFMAVHESLASSADRFSETVVCFADGSNQQLRHPDARTVVPTLRGDEAPVVRISVASAVFKLAPAFLEACRAIASQAARPVVFRFFTHLRGAAHQHARRRLQEWLPGCEVLPRTDYATYLQALNACDVQLAPFPFGGTNSTMDALQCAIPTVTLEGREPHARSDALLLRPAGQPGWTITAHVGEYVAAALRLVDDTAGRLAVRRALAALDLDATFYDTQFMHRASDLTALLGWLAAHHEAVRADGRHLWRCADRAQVTG